MRIFECFIYTKFYTDFHQQLQNYTQLIYGFCMHELCLNKENKNIKFIYKKKKKLCIIKMTFNFYTSINYINCSLNLKFSWFLFYFIFRLINSGNEESFND